MVASAATRCETARAATYAAPAGLGDGFRDGEDALEWIAYTWEAGGGGGSVRGYGWETVGNNNGVGGGGGGGVVARVGMGTVCCVLSAFC